ncbi:MAG TPA: hypothetical protein VHD81_08050 [Mycobacteriales bacterium]|nr:hypothetical protein [Mycobacteriales bacterium]
MPSEDYVRPPIVAIEVRSQRAAIWRFRIVMGALLALLVVLIAWVAHIIITSGNDTGGAVGGLRPLHALVTTLR